MLYVLIADDSLLFRDLVREILSVIPAISFIEVEDGMLAVKQARVHRPKLVISDVLMPGMNGVEVCRILKTDPLLSGCRIILMTASSDPSYKVLAHKAGADGFLRKPFDETQLLGEVVEALSSHV